MEVSCLLNDAGRPFVGSELRNNLVLRDSKMQLKRRLIAFWHEIGFPLQSFPEVKFGEVSLSFRAEGDIRQNSPSV